jgi:hypothetical protein
LFALILLSSVLLAPIDEQIQGVIAVLAVLAVLIFVAGFAIGLGAGMLLLLWCMILNLFAKSLFVVISGVEYHVGDHANAFACESRVFVLVDQLGL